MSQLVLIRQSIFFPFALDYRTSFKKHSNKFTHREVIDLLSSGEKAAPGLRACSPPGQMCKQRKNVQMKKKKCACVFYCYVFLYHFRDEKKYKKVSIMDSNALWSLTLDAGMRQILS